MRQTLFYIPQQLAGVPIVGVLLALWIAASLVSLIGPIRRHGFSGETITQIFFTVLIGAVIALVLPQLIGAEGLPIRGFGVMLLVAVCAGGWLGLRRARQMGVDPEVILSLGMWVFVAGIIGARGFYVIQKWPEFQRHNQSLRETVLSVFNVTQGGLVVYGSLIAGAAALIAFCRRNKLPVLAMCDLAAPAVVLGMAIGRIGCFMNGCCYGGPCELPWKVAFPWGSPPHVRQAQQGTVALHGLLVGAAADSSPTIEQVVPGSEAERQGLRAGQQIVAINRQPIDTAQRARMALLAIDQPGTDLAIVTADDPQPKRWTLAAPLPRSLPVHPTQIYATIDGLLICFLLWNYYPFRRREGEVTALLATVYPITRFLMEVIRTDELPIFLGMTISQNISLLILIVAAVLWIYLLRQPKQSEAQLAAPLAPAV
jgi:phosphatidylglycerol:prolipoprotein diacylglycerol transferase